MKTKTGTTTREERKLLEAAAKIIHRELIRGQEVRIRGLGRFNVGMIEANMAGPGSTEKKMATIGVVRFRPFDALKKAVRGLSVPSNGKPVTPMSKVVALPKTNTVPAPPSQDPPKKEEPKPDPPIASTGPIKW